MYLPLTIFKYHENITNKKRDIEFIVIIPGNSNNANKKGEGIR